MGVIGRKGLYPLSIWRRGLYPLFASRAKYRCYGLPILCKGDAIPFSLFPIPLILHFQNSAGKRLSLQPSETYHVKRSSELHQALDRFMEE